MDFSYSGWCAEPAQSSTKRRYVCNMTIIRRLGAWSATREQISFIHRAK